MNFDELRSAWQGQDPARPIHLDRRVVTNLIRREQRQWTHMIRRRDIREVAATVVMLPVLLYFAITETLVSMYLLALGTAFVAGAFVFDYLRQRPHQPRENQPILEYLQRCLAQTDHQIELLRKVFWWYILPLALGQAAVLVEVLHMVVGEGITSRAEWQALLYLAGLAVVFSLIDIGVYALNQRAVRKELQPRKRELQDLLEAYGQNE